MRNVIQDGMVFYTRLMDNALVAFDNHDRHQGITKMYTGGRNPDGCLNGQILTDDIRKMKLLGEEHFKDILDIVAMHEDVFTQLLIQPAFQEILYGSLMIIPTTLISVDTMHNTTTVLLFSSRDLSHAIQARSVKI